MIGKFARTATLFSIGKCWPSRVEGLGIAAACYWCTKTAVVWEAKSKGNENWMPDESKLCSEHRIACLYMKGSTFFFLLASSGWTSFWWSGIFSGLPSFVLPFVNYDRDAQKDRGASSRGCCAVHGEMTGCRQWDILQTSAENMRRSAALHGFGWCHCVVRGIRQSKVLN